MPEWKFNEVLAQVGTDVAELLQKRRFAEEEKKTAKKRTESDRKLMDIILGASTTQKKEATGDGAFNDILNFENKNMYLESQNNGKQLPDTTVGGGDVPPNTDMTKAEAFVNLSPGAKKKYLELNKAKELFSPKESNIKWVYPDGMNGKIVYQVDKDTNEIKGEIDNPFYTKPIIWELTDDRKHFIKINKDTKKWLEKVKNKFYEETEVDTYKNIDEVTEKRKDGNYRVFRGYNNKTNKIELINEFPMGDYTTDEVESNLPVLTKATENLEQELNQIEIDLDTDVNKLNDLQQYQNYFNDSTYPELLYNTSPYTIRKKKLNKVREAAQVMPEKEKDMFFNTFAGDKKRIQKLITKANEKGIPQEDLINAIEDLKDESDKVLRERYKNAEMTHNDFADDKIYEIYKTYYDIFFDLEVLLNE